MERVGSQDCTSNFKEDDQLTLNLESITLSSDESAKYLTGEMEITAPNSNNEARNSLDKYNVRGTTNGSIPNQSSRDGMKARGSSSNKMSDSDSSQSNSVPFVPPLVRNFERILKKPENLEGNTQASAAPLGMVYKPRKTRADVFSKIQQLESKSGPIIHLRHRLNQIVNVLIRRRRKVPYISRVIDYKGTLVLFDKHMNLYLEDVIESFKYSRDDEIRKRARHRDSILLRGDNIILIS